MMQISKRNCVTPWVASLALLTACQTTESTGMAETVQSAGEGSANMARSTTDDTSFAKPGFVVEEEDGRLWVFREGAPELEQFHADGELAKHVIRPGAGPGGRTLKGPDSDTILAYVAAVPGFATIVEEGRLWVFAEGSDELAEYQQSGELAKHVTRINAGPLGKTIKAPDTDTLDAYLRAIN